MSEIRSTVTDNEWEMECNSNTITLPDVEQSSLRVSLGGSSFRTSDNYNTTITDDSHNSISNSTIITSTKSNQPSINYNHETALFVIDDIVQHEEGKRERERERERESRRSNTMVSQ